MATERIEFPGFEGVRLSARLERPNRTPPQAYALFAHCFTCTKNLRAAVAISRALCDEGSAVMRFDFTGLGESEGDFADTNFSSNVADLTAAGRYLAAWVSRYLG
jgi:putative redox protein